MSVSTPALKAYFRIMSAWNVPDNLSSQILNVSNNTLKDWEGHPDQANLDDEQLFRLSHILGIYRSLHTIYCDSLLADTWIMRTNSNDEFRGRRPIDLLSSGKYEDLQTVHDILRLRAS